MESFLRIDTNTPFQNCKDSLIAGKDSSGVFFGNGNQFNSYQNHSAQFDTGTLLTGSSMLSNEVTHYTLIVYWIIDVEFIWNK